jgi:hypothetical protein
MSCYKVSTMSCYKPVNYVPERFTLRFPSVLEKQTSRVASEYPSAW